MLNIFIPSGIFVLRDAINRRREKVQLMKEQMKRRRASDIEKLLDDYVELCEKLNEVKPAE
jgi:hypothetical protein